MSKRESDVSYAGFWLRFVAAMIDSLILTIGSFVIIGFSLGIAILLGPAGTGTSAVQAIAVLFASLVDVIITWLYFALMESSSKRATIGKMAMRIEVTGLRHEQVSFARATGRHFAKIISAIPLYFGFIIAGFTKNKQALHDIIAECLIVKGE